MLPPFSSTRFFLTGGLLLALAAPASATVLFSDAFAYANGTSDSAISKWTVSGSQTNALVVQNERLVVNGIGTGFNRLAADLGSVSSTGSLFVGFDLTVTDAPAASINLINFATTAGGGTNTNSGGYFNVAAVDANNVKFGVSVNPNNTGVQTTADYAVNATYRVVVEYTFVDGALNNLARLYVDGSLVATSLYGASPAEVAGFQYIGIKQPTLANSAGFLIDDVAAATTFAEAATFPSAVPEPASAAALLGAGTLALVVARRRRVV